MGRAGKGDKWETKLTTEKWIGCFFMIHFFFVSDIAVSPLAFLKVQIISKGYTKFEGFFNSTYNQGNFL